MQDDPARYWQDLTDNYRQMSDGELLELAAKPEDLTDVAQQVLRDELRLRRLDLESATAARSTKNDSRPNPGGSNEDDGQDGLADGDGGPPPVEYTWKTLLRDCESNQQAWQLYQALKRKGIQSWVREVPAYSVDVLGPQIYVAADQLEQAQAVSAQPIPRDIIEESQMAIPEFELPVCPQCGSKDGPVLDSVDPVNAWFCEACGAEWTEPESVGDDSAEGETTTSS